MSRYCLDTSAYSQFKRGHSGVVQVLENAGWVGMPAPVIGELYAGFEMGSRREQNLAELEEFLAHPVVEELVVDRGVASLYGAMVADLRARGTPLPTNDIWVAAICALAGATLLTFDAHFRAIPRIGTLILEATATP